jgi:hypothetical protein
MQQRQLLRGILVAAALLVLMLVASIGWILTQSPVSLLLAKPPLPEIVRLAPRSTSALLVLAAPLSQVQNFLQAAAPAQRRRLTHRAWDRFFSNKGPQGVADFFAAGNINFRREVAPWLGSETLLALLPSQADPESKPEILLATSTRNLDRSNLFLNLLWQRQEFSGLTQEIQTYKGVQIVATTEGKSPLLAGAAFGDRYVVFASRPQVIQAAIDSWQVPDLSLAADPHFQTVVQSVQDPRVGWAYLRMNDGSNAAGSLRDVGLGLGVDFRGLVAESVAEWSLAPEDATLWAQKTEVSPGLLNHVPQSAQAFISGHDLRADWRVLQTLQPLAGLDLSRLLQPMQKQSGLDWNQDLFRWMRGDYALVAMPASRKPVKKSAAAKPSWLLISEMGETAPAAISDLDARIESLGLRPIPVPLSRSEWGDATAWIPASTATPSKPVAADGVTEEGSTAEISAETMKALTLQLAKAKAFHLERDHLFYLAPSLEILERALADAPLGSARAWKQTAPISKSNQGLMYIHLPESSVLLPPSLARLKTLLDPVQTITLTTTSTKRLQPTPQASADPQSIMQTGKIFVALQ